MASPGDTFEKRVSAKKWYSFDWASFLGSEEIIQSATVTATVHESIQSSPDALTVSNKSNTDSTVTFRLEGGTANTVYKVACLITTSNDQTEESVIYVSVV